MESSYHTGSGSSLRKGVFILLIAVAAYFFLTFITYSQDDPGWSYQADQENIHNLGGAAGAWFADVFFSLFGIFAFLFPVMLVWSGWQILRGRDHMNMPLLILRWSGFVLTIIGGCGLGALHLRDFGLKLAEGAGAGGILGKMLEAMLVNALSSTGATLVLVATLMVGLQFAGISWLKISEAVGGVVLSLYNRTQQCEDYNTRRKTQLSSARGEKNNRGF